MSVCEHAALYRLHAAKCIDLARNSTDSETRLTLFDMARSWRMLADQAEKNSETVMVYETPEPRQHVAQQQQQQQQQPDDPEKKE
jgi:hypothetical protein